MCIEAIQVAKATGVLLRQCPKNSAPKITTIFKHVHSIHSWYPVQSYYVIDVLNLSDE